MRDKKAEMLFIKQHSASCKVCDKCRLWVSRCKREDGEFDTIADIKKDNICSQHFPDTTMTIDAFEYLPEAEKKVTKYLQ